MFTTSRVQLGRHINDLLDSSQADLSTELQAKGVSKQSIIKFDRYGLYTDSNKPTGFIGRAMLRFSAFFSSLLPNQQQQKTKEALAIEIKKKYSDDNETANIVIEMLLSKATVTAGELRDIVQAAKTLKNLKAELNKLDTIIQSHIKKMDQFGAGLDENNPYALVSNNLNKSKDELAKYLTTIIDSPTNLAVAISLIDILNKCLHNINEKPSIPKAFDKSIVLQPCNKNLLPLLENIFTAVQTAALRSINC